MSGRFEVLVSVSDVLRLNDLLPFRAIKVGREAQIGWGLVEGEGPSVVLVLIENDLMAVSLRHAGSSLPRHPDSRRRSVISASTEQSLRRFSWISVAKLRVKVVKRMRSSFLLKTSSAR